MSDSDLEKDAQEETVPPYPTTHGLTLVNLIGGVQLVGKLVPSSTANFIHLEQACRVVMHPQHGPMLVGVQALHDYKSSTLAVSNGAIVWMAELAPHSFEAQAFASTIEDSTRMFEEHKKAAELSPLQLHKVNPNQQQLVVPSGKRLIGNDGRPLS